MFAITDRHLFLISVALVPVGLALSIIHPFFAILTVLFCALVSVYTFNAISQLLFQKQFNPPSKVPGMPEPHWSDWLLFLPWVFMVVSMLFVFGNLADCFFGTIFWHGWFNLCG